MRLETLIKRGLKKGYLCDNKFVEINLFCIKKRSKKVVLMKNMLFKQKIFQLENFVVK